MEHFPTDPNVILSKSFAVNKDVVRVDRQRLYVPRYQLGIPPSRFPIPGTLRRCDAMGNNLTNAERWTVGILQWPTILSACCCCLVCCAVSTYGD